MLTSHLAPRSSQSFYTETEAAETLGISLDTFRDLVHTHIAQSEEDKNNIAGATYQSSDLVVLKLLAKMPHRT